MIKYITLAIIIYLVYLFFFRAKREKVKTSNPKQTKKDSETMVECTKCSVFISPKEAFMKDGKFFCSKECMKG